jgi:hypothetical protein
MLAETANATTSRVPGRAARRQVVAAADPSLITLARCRDVVRHAPARRQARAAEGTLALSYPIRIGGGARPTWTSSRR